MTECTKTYDEQDQENPLKPFPKKQYLKETIALMDIEPVLFIEKSRTMMCSWAVSGWATHKAATKPHTGVIFQSNDKDRALNDIEYSRCLYENSLPILKERWPLSKAMHLQPNDTLEFANGSWLRAIPGNPDKIRSAHPTIVILDEAAHIVEGEESFNVAVATRCLHLIALSSALPGWFRDATEFANPVDWLSCDEAG